MNRLVLGVMGGSVAIAAIVCTLGLRAPERTRTRTDEASPHPASERRAPARSTDADEAAVKQATQQVSQVVRASMADAVGEVTVRLRDQRAAEADTNEAAAVAPPANAARVPTPEEEEKFRAIRQALGESAEKEAKEQ